PPAAGVALAVVAVAPGVPPVALGAAGVAPGAPPEGAADTCAPARWAVAGAGVPPALGGGVVDPQAAVTSAASHAALRVCAARAETLSSILMLDSCRVSQWAHAPQRDEGVEASPLARGAPPFVPASRPAWAGRLRIARYHA